jgi:hypothetical protein
VCRTPPSVYNEVRGKDLKLANFRSFRFCLPQNLAGHRAVPKKDLAALSQSIWTYQFGEPGLFSAPQLSDLYRKLSMST